MTVWLKQELTTTNVLLLVVLVVTLGLHATWWIAGPSRSAVEEQRELSARQVEELTRAVGDLSKTISQLQSANELLMQTALRTPARGTSLEPQLRAIQAGVDEQNMMFRRYLSQYRRP